MGDSGSPRVPEYISAANPDSQNGRLGQSPSPRVFFILVICLASRTPVPEIALTLSGLLLQATHDRRSQLFQLLLLEHLKLKNEFVAAESESMKREERHAAGVGKLQEEVSKSAKIQELLKDELEASILAKSKADKKLETAQNALTERALQDQKLKTKCDEDEAQRKKAESELAELWSQSAEWLNELKLINRQMTRKLHPSLQTESSS